MKEVDISAENIVDQANVFYNNMKGTDECGDRSWEYCYQRFYEKIKGEQDYDLDYLALNLMVYLASWGMYRGSSFLTAKSYKIHTGAIEIILEHQYAVLLGLDYNAYGKHKKILEDLIHRLQKYYADIRYDIKENHNASNVSDTLISKILLGTLGCVPAYDRYFLIAIGGQKRLTTGSLNINSIRALFEFYKKNAERFEKLRRKFTGDSEFEYPQMKVLDMGLWQIGYNAEQ